VEVKSRIDDPVDPKIVAALSKKFTPEDPHHCAPSQMPEFVLRKQRR